MRARDDWTDRLFRARSWFVLSVLFIVYATTIPWDFAWPPHLDRVVWRPFWDPERGRIAGIPDIVQNVLLFLPFGFFGWIAWTTARRWGIVASAVMVGCAGGALSLCVELLQTMSPTRTPSTADLITNGSGAFLGALAGGYWTTRFAPRWQPLLQRTLRHQPGVLVCVALFIALAFGSLTPFFPTLDVGQLKQTVKGFLRDPWGPKNTASLLPDALLYVALAVCCAMEIPPWREALTRRRSGSSPAAQGFRIAAAVAIVLEGAQFVFTGHSPSLQDVAAGVGGAALGGLLAARWGCFPARTLGDLVRRVPRAALAFGLLFPLATALVPYEFESAGEAFGSLEPRNFIPFAPLFVNINAGTFFNVFSATAAFLPLGYSLAALGTPRTRQVAGCAAWAVACEFAQVPVAGRTFDITMGLYAALMALLGAWLLRRADRMAAGQADR